MDWTRATDAASDLSGFCCCELLLTGVRASRPTAVLIKRDLAAEPALAPVAKLATASGDGTSDAHSGQRATPEC